MRLLVCGSRYWEDRDIVFTVLTGFAAQHDVTRVIHGGAKGADSIAGKWAHDRDIGWEFPANWLKHGKAAGPIRNRAMLEHGKPDIVLAFKDNFNILKPGGTEHMVQIAKAAGVPCYVIGKA